MLAVRATPPAFPVSYTHLRAHETDSYLVCRLLLEKTQGMAASVALLAARWARGLGLRCVGGECGVVVGL